MNDVLSPDTGKRVENASEEEDNIKQSTKVWITNLIESLGEWRDRALVITGIFYAAGYLIWSWNALENNLGLLPAFQFQYIIAGIGPVLICGIAGVGGYRFWKWLMNNWLTKMDKAPTPIWRFINLITVVIIVLYFGTLFFYDAFSLLLRGAIFFLTLYMMRFANGDLILRLKKYHFQIVSSKSDRKYSLTENMKMLVVFVTGMAILYWVWHNHEKIDQFVVDILQKFISEGELLKIITIPFMVAVIFGSSKIFPFVDLYRFMTFIFLVIGFVILGLLFYQERIYTRLPQEFGGVKPRCAYLDVKMEDLSNEMREAIFTSRQLNQNTNIQRSTKLDVLFTNNNVIMIRPKQPVTGSKGIVYEIPRSNIQAISWCQ